MVFLSAVFSITEIIERTAVKKKRIQVNNKDHCTRETNLRFFANSEAFGSEAKSVSSALRELPACFSDTLDYHMKRNGITCDKLCELTDISEATVTRYRSKDCSHYKLSIVILICIALRLNPILSFDLVRKAGFNFTGSLEHTAYQMLIMSAAHIDIDQSNKYLLSIGLKPLNKQCKE